MIRCIGEGLAQISSGRTALGTGGMGRQGIQADGGSDGGSDERHMGI